MCLALPLGREKLACAGRHRLQRRFVQTLIAERRLLQILQQRAEQPSLRIRLARQRV